MDFVIQYNMLSDALLTSVKEAVQDLPHQFVGLIPFSREITSDKPIIGLDHIPYGSTSFVETTHELGWKGLSFDLEKFSYSSALDNRDDMLNSGVLPVIDAAIILNAAAPDKNVFIRPDHDLKQFAGAIYTAKEAHDFFIDAMTTASSGSYRIQPNFLVVMSEPRNILCEWRWFIIGGKVIDGSIYRRNGQLKKDHVTDEALQATAQVLADKWLPSTCCVMDTALLDSGETKVVEFNCINGSGFYDHDIKKIMTNWHHYDKEILS